MAKRRRSSSPFAIDDEREIYAGELPEFLRSFFPGDVPVHVLFNDDSAAGEYTVRWERVRVHAWRSDDADDAPPSRLRSEKQSYASCVSHVTQKYPGRFQFDATCDVHVLIFFNSSRMSPGTLDEIDDMTCELYKLLPTAVMLRSLSNLRFPVTPLQYLHPFGSHPRRVEDLGALFIPDDDDTSKEEEAYDRKCLRFHATESDLRVFLCVNPASEYVHTCIGKDFITRAVLERCLPTHQFSFLTRVLYLYLGQDPSSSSISASIIQSKKEPTSCPDFCVLYHNSLKVAQVLLLSERMNKQDILNVLIAEMTKLGFEPACVRAPGG